jgi:hypothetical protein
MKKCFNRIDDFKPYSLNNKNHQRQDTINGTGTSGQICRPIQCFLNENLIAEYVSLSDACRVVGYSIWRSITSQKLDRKNSYVWKYKLQHLKRTKNDN